MSKRPTGCDERENLDGGRKRVLRRPKYEVLTGLEKTFFLAIQLSLLPLPDPLGLLGRRRGTDSSSGGSSRRTGGRVGADVEGEWIVRVDIEFGLGDRLEILEHLSAPNKGDLAIILDGPELFAVDLGL